MLPKETAGQIIIGVLNAIREATRFAISKCEQERFAVVFERQILFYDRNKEK